eukprot:g5911.t1
MDDSLTLDDEALIQIETLETLIVWFNKSFQDELVANSDNTTATNTTLTHLNLADGFLLYQAGTLLSPEHFPQDNENTNKLVQALMESNSTTGNTNTQMWIKRSSLLKLFSKGLIEFFQDIAHIDIETHLSDHVDIVQVAKNDEMLGKVELMKLLLAASINSKEKQRYIEIIMGMDDEKQEQLMYVIQEFSEIARPMDDEDGMESEDDNNNSNNKDADSDGNSEANNSNGANQITKRRQNSDSNDDTRRSSFASSIGSDDSEDIQRSSPSPSNKKSNSSSSTSKQSTAAFNIVKHELEDLKLQYNKLNEAHIGITNKYKELQATMRNNKAKEAAMKAEALNAEHTQELERLLERAEQNLMEVRATSAERQRDLQQTAQRLADELDIANEKIQTLDKTELALNKAKQRLSEMASLKSQVKELEEQNTEYMEKMLQQEATVNVTVPQLKSQVERYKDKVVDLDSALTGKSARIMAQEKDISKLKEQIVELTKKKNSLHEQLDNAQLEIEQLKDEATDAGFGFSNSSSGSSSNNYNNNEDKETIVRLERQVKALRMMSKKATATATTTSGGDGSSDIHILKDELDDAIRSKDRFQSELMKSKTRIAELEQIVQQAGSSGENNTDSKVPSSPPPSTKMMDRLKQRNEKLSRQNNELKHEVMELEQKLVESTEANNNDGKANLEALLEEKDAVVKQLKNSLKEKETTCNQLSLEKEKLENYVKQALKATKMKYKVAAQSLKENILKKDETIVQLSNKVEILSRNREHMKQQHRTEERLVMSALYEVGLEMQRRMVTNGGVSGNVSGPSSNNMSSWLNKRRAQKRS